MKIYVTSFVKLSDSGSAEKDAPAAAGGGDKN
jgi:hypothetical protein